MKIRELMAEHDIKVVTPTVAHVSDELLCDPIIWTADDMDGDNIPKGVSAEDAFNAFHDNGCYRMLEQRSLEEGQVILSDLITISLNVR